MLKPINLENMASHLRAMGYDAKANSFVRGSGELADVVNINGLGQVTAYFEQNPVDASKSGLRVYGDLQPGYAERVYGEDGEPIREQIVVNGMRKWDFKRGEPLNDEQLKKKNNWIAVKARKDIIGAVVAAYMIEANGGDLEAVKSAFRLQKYEPSRDAAASDHDAGEQEDTKETTAAPIAPKANTTPGASM